MAWRITCKEGKYRIYSTVIDEYITDYISREEIIRKLFWRRFEQLVQDTLEDVMTFPHGWVDMETNKIDMSKPNEKEEFHKLINDRDSMYFTFLTKIKEVGLNIKMSDIDGVNFGNIIETNMDDVVSDVISTGGNLNQELNNEVDNY